MKKKSFLGGISAKIALLTLAVSGAVLTGCYKESGLDAAAPGSGTTVLDAVYRITGSVTDVESGENVANPIVTCDGQAIEVSNGVYTVKVAEFTAPTKNVTLTFEAPNYNKIVRSITLDKVEAGQAVVYPLSVALKKMTVEEKAYEVSYKVNFVVKDSKTGAPVSTVTTNPATGYVVKGNTPFKVTTAATAAYYESVTVVTLPQLYSDVENEVKETFVEILVTPIDKDPIVADTYTTLSGSLVDVNGKAVAGDVKLMKGATEVQKLTNVNRFNFTLNDKTEAGEYTIAAVSSEKNATATSGNYKVPACGNQSFTVVFTDLGLKPEKPTVYDATYKLTFAAKNVADFTESLTGVKYVFNGQDLKDLNELKGVVAGTYIVKAYKQGFYTGKTTVVLPVVKAEAPSEINKDITVFLTKIATPEPEEKTITLYGEVVDANGNMIKARSIKLNGVGVDPIYDSNHFKFVLPAPKETVTWTVVAEVRRVSMPNRKELTPFKQSITFTYAAGNDAFYKNVSIPYVTRNGIIEISDEEAGDGNGDQGEITPPANSETGLVEETKSTEMKGNGTAEDKTTVTIEKGTVITTASGDPLVTPVIVTRNTAEEKLPTAAQEDQTEIVLRSFFGNPEGAQFKVKPLEIKFADIYGGELGDLELEYKINNVWGPSVNNANNTVAYSNGQYTMLVSHFSQFRATISGELDSISATELKGEPKTQIVNQQNNTEYTRVLEIEYKKAQGGSICEGLAAAINAIYKKETSQKAVNTAIKNIFKKKGMAIGDAFTIIDNLDLEYSVAPYTMVESITVTPLYKIITYNFTLNGKKVAFSVKTLDKYTVDAKISTFGHGHGHGHGNDLNAGGGIIVGE